MGHLQGNRFRARLCLRTLTGPMGEIEIDERLRAVVAAAGDAYVAIPDDVAQDLSKRAAQRHNSPTSTLAAPAPAVRRSAPNLPDRVPGVARRPRRGAFPVDRFQF